MKDTEILFTKSGQPFVRTPEEYFDNLPDFNYSQNYIFINGLRMHYIDEGPRNGEVILLLHGQPTWSYLYRKMIPILVAAGHRVIAPDHIGMGRSDKPTRIEDYTYHNHIDWVEQFISKLNLKDITLFVQDWGSLIGLRILGNNPDLFARLIVCNGLLPTIPEGFKPVQLPETMEPDTEITLPFDRENPNKYEWMEGFQKWVRYTLIGTRFRPSDLVNNVATVVSLSIPELHAYDAPFPSQIYMSGVRAFPSLINTVGDIPTNEKAREVLDNFEKPTLTIFSERDPNMGSEATQSLIKDRVKGAIGQPHHRYPDSAHFIQEDKGEDLARRINEFIQLNPR